MLISCAFVSTLYKQIQTKQKNIRDVTSSSVPVDRIQGSNKRLLLHDPKETSDRNSGVENHIVKNGCGARYKY